MLVNYVTYHETNEQWIDYNLSCFGKPVYVTKGHQFTDQETFGFKHLAAFKVGTIKIYAIQYTTAVGTYFQIHLNDRERVKTITKIINQNIHFNHPPSVLKEVIKFLLESSFVMKDATSTEIVKTTLLSLFNDYALSDYLEASTYLETLHLKFLKEGSYYQATITVVFHLTSSSAYITLGNAKPLEVILHDINLINQIRRYVIDLLS